MKDRVAYNRTVAAQKHTMKVKNPRAANASLGRAKGELFKCGDIHRREYLKSGYAEDYVKPEAKPDIETTEVIPELEVKESKKKTSKPKKKKKKKKED